MILVLFWIKNQIVTRNLSSNFNFSNPREPNRLRKNKDDSTVQYTKRLGMLLLYTVDNSTAFPSSGGIQVFQIMIKYCVVIEVAEESKILDNE